MKYTIIEKTNKPKGNRQADAGVDLFVADSFNNGQTYKLYFGEQVLIPSGVKFDIPEGTLVQIENKSGIATKKGLSRGATICDHSYRGHIMINLHKVSIGTEDLFEDVSGFTHEFSELQSHEERKKFMMDAYTIIKPGDKIAQAIIYKISTEELEEISNEEYEQVKTERGDRGFGEGTGVN